MDGCLPVEGIQEIINLGLHPFILLLTFLEIPVHVSKGQGVCFHLGRIQSKFKIVFVYHFFGLHIHFIFTA